MFEAGTDASFMLIVLRGGLRVALGGNPVVRKPSLVLHSIPYRPNRLFRLLLLPTDEGGGLGFRPTCIESVAEGGGPDGHVRRRPGG